MKTIKLIFLVAITVITGREASAQTVKEEKVVEVKPTAIAATRGKDPIFKFMRSKGAKKYLKCPVFGKKRGASPKCSIQVQNDYDKDIDLYLDGNYEGSIKAHDKGVIENHNGYAGIHGISEDSKLMWKESGDCSINYVYKLANK
jgi:hypothetical protein